VVFTIDKGAADRLARARAEARYARRYVALASAAVTPERGEWEAPIGRAADPRHRAAFGRDAAPALTRYVQIARIEAGGALLALEPVTGRTHQLRVHAAHAGAPLLGDATYGGPRRVVLASGSVLALDRVALHCARVEIEGEELCALAPVPGDLADFGRALGVDAALWERAITPSRSAR
jgi:23S rRNA pseudouridine955/2504/2580 synthase/23S rRNA pseudouridine1911/1915/1917 synthase